MYVGSLKNKTKNLQFSDKEHLNIRFQLTLITPSIWHVQLYNDLLDNDLLDNNGFKIARYANMMSLLISNNILPVIQKQIMPIILNHERSNSFFESL